MTRAVSRLAPMVAFVATFGLAAPPEPTTTTTTTTILPFQGSYTQPKVAEPVYGGHASAMGPPPEAASAKGQPSPVQFEEVRGLTEKTFGGGQTKDHLLESGGSGIALIDYDNDGLLDIYAVSAFELDERRQRIPHPNALYRNLGNWRFENVAHKAGVDAAAWGNGVCAGDFDGDGRLDLYVTNFGSNFLFRNNGDGTFTDVAKAAGVQAGGWSTGCAFFDGNGDGHLDLYVARYAAVTWDDVVRAQRTMTWRGGPKVMVGPVGLPGAPDLYYENRGDGTFAEVTEARGLKDAAPAWGFGVIATDYDGDGWTDLYVANDSNPNFLYHNRGDGRFESVGLLSGVALNAEGRAQAGMGVDAGDYDGDGWMDLVVTNFAHDSNTLYRNLGDGTFADMTQAAGLAAPTFERMGWGTVFFDADLDGWLDLFFANGHIYPQVDAFHALKETFRQKSQLFLGDGRTFRDVSDSAGGGLRVEKSSRGLAVGDLDNDGDLDLVVSAMDDVPTVLENRQHTGRHWIGFQVKKTGTNPFAIGARVTVDAGGRRQVREIHSGGSYLSQSDLRAHFGLGGSAGPVRVEVQLGRDRWAWPAVAVDRYTTLVLRDEDRVKAAAR
jgi:enediyne biosynthesis protein E4